MEEKEYKETKAKIAAKYDMGQIDAKEYIKAWNEAESKFGVSLSEWPCDPDESK